MEQLTEMESTQASLENRMALSIFLSENFTTTWMQQKVTTHQKMF